MNFLVIRHAPQWLFYEALGSLALQVFKWKMNRKMQQVPEGSSRIGQEFGSRLGCFHSQTSISIRSQGVFDCCPEDGPLKPTAPKSVSLHGDHGQESFVDLPCRQFWGCEQTTLGRERARQALSQLSANEQKVRRLQCPSLFRDEP